MKPLEYLRLDTWYGIVLYLGVASAGLAILANPTFIEAKHLLGLGLGCILIGLAHLGSEKSNHFQLYYNMGSYRDVHLTPFTKIVAYLGTAIAILFLVLIIIDLI